MTPPPPGKFLEVHMSEEKNALEELLLVIKHTIVGSRCALMTIDSTSYESRVTISYSYSCLYALMISSPHTLIFSNQSAKKCSNIKFR